MFFFFKQKTAYEFGTGAWSSDVCSSDLPQANMISLLLLLNNSEQIVKFNFIMSLMRPHRTLENKKVSCNYRLSPLEWRKRWKVENRWSPSSHSINRPENMFCVNSNYSLGSFGWQIDNHWSIFIIWKSWLMAKCSINGLTVFMYRAGHLLSITDQRHVRIWPMGTLWQSCYSNQYTCIYHSVTLVMAGMEWL